MALKVIGAGLGRTATFSLKFALEHIGFGPCYHMSEVLAGARRSLPLWLDAVADKPDWDAIFAGFHSTTDYPAAHFWHELAEHYPDAKIVLTTRDPDSWFDSVSETIFSERMNSQIHETPFGGLMRGVIFDVFGNRINDRAFMTDWFRQRNQQVVDTLPPERLLVFHPKEGWEPLCSFLGVPVPPEPFPRVNSRDELGGQSDEHGGLPADPAELEAFAREYIDQLKAGAFSSTA
ncbi:hypothetical protein FHS61_002443 [Altererythrobacter atlanticus]|uniref:Uncharacterized protein n=1 Tax=Croceibacterium atlanticum TaxID=1267766 RepID=A0A0F7KR20_9SPHN|nr:sulfotransferase family protein [Croceibacterium atlanticum]AKH42024.1 hypothetical protein WYH_00976 [Croceibacterium atlanticum]MBB5733408.1 hypothetical protein [Croceibacterium atlanticum]